MEIRYVVKGRWPFPVDMLRRDGSRAATPEDQAIIDSLCEEFAPDRSGFEEVEVSLVGPNEPNTARWESFSWSVPGDVMHALAKADAVRLRAEETLLAKALAKLDPEERALVEGRMGRHADR